jgi:hypothetical protein
VLVAIRAGADPVILQAANKARSLLEDAKKAGSSS